MVFDMTISSMKNRSFCRLVLTLLFTLAAMSVSAEAGKGVYRFLNLPYAARLAAVGGENVSMQAEDVAMGYMNPALLHSSLSHKLSASYVNYLDDANGAFLSFAHAKDSLNCFGASIVFMGYGNFDGYDIYGNPTGDFSSGDFALTLSYARYLGAGFRLGLSLKPVYSHLENYSSFGLAVDVGANYYRPDVDFSAGLSIRNFGFQFTGYYETAGGQHREELPWNVQLGVTKGLLHAPFRFSVTYDRLNDWNLDYFRPKQNASELLGAEDLERDEISFADMLFRHLIFGVELTFSKNFYLAVGYNYRRSQEYALSGARAINGFSFGAGVRIYKFYLDLAYAQYAAAGNTFTLSLATALDEFKKK